jgi:hypothetical protein
LTVRPEGRHPGGRDCDSTVRFGWLDVCCVTLPTPKPAFFGARFAFVSVSPTTFGIFGSAFATVRVTAPPASMRERLIPYGSA